MTLPIQLAIVDDHKMLRQTWKMILERDERLAVIAECDSGEEAIACAERLSPQVMLMDINMAPMNGFEATRRITTSHPHIKIIGISINNQATYARNMIAMGARGYVTKNAESREMIEAILAVHAGKTYICKEVAEKMDKSSF